MLVYEKNNKLNINFDNEVSENSDLQISKEDGKTEVLIDGQSISGGGGTEPVIVTVNLISETEGTWSGATWNDLVEAYYDGRAYLSDGGMLVERITGHSIDPSTRKLQRLIVLMATREDLLIHAELSELNIVYFTTYHLGR